MAASASSSSATSTATSTSSLLGSSSGKLAGEPGMVNRTIRLESLRCALERIRRCLL